MAVGTVPAGLVGQVTSRTFSHHSLRTAVRELNRERRFRRMRRVIIAAADATRDLPGVRLFGVLVTLTYAADVLWSARHVAEYLQRTRVWLRRRKVPCRYQWVIELTQRGRPHYHVLFWLTPGVQHPKPDMSGHWTHGLSRIERARHPVGYVVKYATKGSEGALPRGARLFGVGSAEASVRLVRHRVGLPIWLDDAASKSEQLGRVPRVVWVGRSTGEIHTSPYRIEWDRDDDGRMMMVVRDLPVVPEVHSPSPATAHSFLAPSAGRAQREAVDPPG